MPNNALNLQNNEHFSVNFLNRQLTNGCKFGHSNKFVGQWFDLTNEKHAQFFQNETSMSSEKCVLVGQAINIETLQKITDSIFPNTNHVVVSAHHLHGRFSQQAILLELFHATTNNSKTGTSLDQKTKLITSEVLLTISQQYFLDCFEVTDIQLSVPGLIVMDMDSTIINMECIDEIAALAGVGDKVSALTERAMQGELDFNQSLQARLSCLTGIKVTELEKLKSRLPINPGFATTMQYLQKNGWITCIASGGFTYFADYIKETFELTHAHSNVLSIKDGALAGGVEGDIVNAQMKQQILLDKCQLHNIKAQQTIAIGDGANDLLMMDVAALGVAYKAKPKVQLAANANIHYCGFEGLLYCLVP